MGASQGVKGENDGGGGDLGRQVCQAGVVKKRKIDQVLHEAAERLTIAVAPGGCTCQ